MKFLSYTRAIPEIAAVRLTCEQASEVLQLEQFLAQTGPEKNGRSSDQRVDLDEYFHCQLMKLARNVEMQRTLENSKARIRYFRWIDMDSKRETTQDEHRNSVNAIPARDTRRVEIYQTLIICNAIRARDTKRP